MSRWRDGPRLDLATKVYEHLEDFAKVSKAVEDEFDLEASRTNAKYISDDRRVAILRTHLTAQYAATAKSFSDPELLTVLNQLHDRNDAHAAFKRFRQKAASPLTPCDASVLALGEQSFFRPMS